MESDQDSRLTSTTEPLMGAAASMRDASSVGSNATTGAAVSAGSRTRRIFSTRPVKPSRSVAVATSVMRPVASGVTMARPRESSATCTPFTVSVFAATAENASASTVTTTG